MPEAEPIPTQEQVHTLNPEEHVHTHAEVNDHFTATAEHGSPGHVCTPECNHTQQEADQFADNLFSEAETKRAAHGESDHVCDASCKHTQAEADNFADSLFKDNADHNHSHEKINHGEKGHVCTAECKHTQAEADSFADKLFDTAKEHAAHGERGHVCDASCKHTQEQADRFADELFRAKTEQSQATKDYVKSAAQVYEQVAKVNTVEEASDQAQLHMQAQEAFRAQREAQMAHEINRDITTDNEVKVQPKSAPKDKARDAEPLMAEASQPHELAEQANSSIDQVQEKSVSETGDKYREVHERIFEENTDNLAETRTLQADGSEAELDATQTEDQYGSLSPDMYTDADDIVGSEDLLADFAPSVFSEEDEALEVETQAPLAETSALDAIEGNIFDFNEDAELTVGQDEEAELSDISKVEESYIDTTEATEQPLKRLETAEEVLALVPELEPIKELVPAIVEFAMDSPEKAKLVQEIEPILDTLIKLFPNSEGRKEISAEVSKQLLEQLELLSLKFGISTDNLLKSLEIDPENIELSQLIYEILHGLKKWLSLEYSLEFTSSQSQSATSSSTAHDPRTLGQLILSMLQNVKMSYAVSRSA